MRIAITGKQGQVVRSLLEKAGNRAEVIALGRPELDLARPETIAPAIARAQPDFVVSAAAYTAVDQAEDEPDLAFVINAEGAGAVAKAAATLGIPVIHLSTDYVFDGTKNGAYTEEDAPAPRSVYGASKLAGEKAVAAANPEHVILRTAWVYSPFGRNFVRAMLNLAETRDRLRVVDDQHGNPTSALDIAEAVLAIAKTWQCSPEARSFGVYHFAGSGATSWCGLARQVFTCSRALGGPHATVDAITSEEYPTKAERPRNSRLDCSRFETDFSFCAPEWQESVDLVVQQLLANGV